MRFVADIILLIGAIFVFLGALGLIRMPDVFNRIQVGTKAVTLGSIGIVLGILLLYPQWWAKLIAILGFILLTSPASSSALARAFYHAGVYRYQAQTNHKKTLSTQNTTAGNTHAQEDKA